MRSVLNKIVPSEEKKRVESFSRLIVKTIKNMGYEAKVMGSVAKGTWLKGDVDIDIFVFFDQKLSKKRLEKEGIKIGKNVFKKLGGSYEIGYAEHPYVKGRIEKYKVDIVPCYRLKRFEAKSSVDRTPFHTKYVLSKINEKLRKEILLLKKFCKGQGIYGSELKVEGLSGYLCELLVIKYGSFSKVLRAVSKFKEGEIIDLEKYYREKEYGMVREKFDAPLIVVDPVDKNRNVAAVLSEKNFKKFVNASKKYLKNPSESFFFPPEIKPIPPSEIRNCIFIIFPGEKVLDDIIYPQMRSTAKSLKKQLERNGFEVERYGAWANSSFVIVLKLKRSVIPEDYIHLGPPLRLKHHVSKFLKKYPNAKKKGKRFAVKLKRKFVSAEDFVRDYIKRGEGVASHLNYKDATVLKEPKDYHGDFAKWLTKWYLSV